MILCLTETHLYNRMNTLIRWGRMMARQKKQSSSKTQVATSGKDLMEFKKTNKAIGLRVSKGKLTIMGRKIFNVMCAHAQKEGQLGKDAPAGVTNGDKYFWLPMSAIIKGATYDSNDTRLVKEHVVELSNIRVEMEDETQWTSERMLASVKIYNPAGLNSKQGKLWFGFAFPPEMFEQIMRPDSYTKLSLYYGSLFTSGHSFALWEICRQYATNPGHLTPREPVAYWATYLMGRPVPVPPEYKYFKRDVLIPAANDVNEIGDITVKLIEHKNGGRSVEELQWEVHLKEQQQLDFPPPPLIDTVLIERIAALGFSNTEAGDLSVSHDSNFIRATLDLVEARLLNHNAPPVGSAAAYFRDALNKRYVDNIPAKIAKPVNRKGQEAIQKKPPSEETILKASRREDAFIHYEKLDTDDRQDLANQYLEVAPGLVAKALRKDGLKSKIAQLAFGDWLADKLYGVVQK